MTVEEVGQRMTAKEMVEWSCEFRLRAEDRQAAELAAEARANLPKG